MTERLLLDCTLRDGGYVNDWEFGHRNIIEIFKRLVSTNVDFIEVGFIDERRTFDINRTIFPDTEAINRIFKGVDKENSTVLGMIDYGTCEIEHIQSCKDSFLDGIRVIFKEHLRDEALAFCGELKKLGYLVFCQMVSVTSYSDEALTDYCVACNRLMPFANSIVDTYGLLDEERLLHITKVLDTQLNPNIKLGFHAHNNMQLAFSNARTFLNYTTNRDILVDGTLYGMGKSAGNAPSELLFTFMNEKYGCNYEVTQALEAIDNVLMGIYHKQYWGYNSFFFISSLTKCHPNYVSYLMNKRTLSVKQVTEILENLDEEKKLLYDAKYIEQKYFDYQSIKCDDAKTVALLKTKFCGNDILLLGPGKNIERQRNKVLEFIAAHKPLIIAVNYIPKNIKADYVFLTNAKRYNQLIDSNFSDINAEPKFIATSNVTRTAGAFQFVLNYESLIDKNTEIIDNSFVMLLKVLGLCNVNSVSVAGFDGYSKKEDNHFDVSREYGFVKEKAEYLNNYVKIFLKDNCALHVEFLTKSFYEEK